MMIGFETLQRALVNWPRRIAATVMEFTAKYLPSIARVRPRDDVIGLTNHPRLRRGEEAFRVFRGLRGCERAVANSLGDVGTDQKPWLLLRARAARWHADPFAPAINADDIEASK
jgi:hypothetical protein